MGMHEIQHTHSLTDTYKIYALNGEASFLHFLFIDLFSFSFRLSSFLNVNQMMEKKTYNKITHILRDRERIYERTAFKSLGVVMRESE